MQNLAKYDPQTVSKIGSEGQGILKAVSSQISDSVNKAVPELGEANIKFSKLATLRDKLKTQLKDENVGTNIKNLLSGAERKEYYKGLFKELDDVVPEKLKFLEDTQDTVVREAFEQLFPGRGGGSGGAQGFANIMRGAGVFSLSQATGPGAALLISPSAHRLGIKTGGAAARGLMKAPPQAAGIAGREALQLRRLLRSKEEGGR